MAILPSKRGKFIHSQAAGEPQIEQHSSASPFHVPNDCTFLISKSDITICRHFCTALVGACFCEAYKVPPLCDIKVPWPSVGLQQEDPHLRSCRTASARPHSSAISRGVRPS